MNTLDIVLGIFLLLGLIQGFRKGLLVELASLVSLILGVLGALYYSHFVFGFLSGFLNWDEQVLHLVSFIATFFVIVVAVSILAKILTKAANVVFLGLANKLLGSLFGTLKMAFIASVILLFINSFETTFSVFDEEKKEASILYKPVASLAPMVLPKLIKEIAKQTSIQEGSSGL